MKNFKFKWLLLSIVLSIASINTAWATDYVYISPGIWKTAGRLTAYFCSSDDKGAQWIDMTKITDDLYRVAVPATNNDKLIFLRMDPDKSNAWGNQWNQTNDLTPTGNEGKVFNIPATIDGVWSYKGSWGSVVSLFPNGKRIYFKPCAKWKEASARFAMFCVDGNTDTWLGMTQQGSTGYYYADIPNALTAYVVLCRMDPSKSGYGWTKDNPLWAQTNDIAPDGSDPLHNLIRATSDTYDTPTTDWWDYAPNATVIGSFNSWDRATGAYPLTGTGGTANVTLSATSDVEFMILEGETWHGNSDLFVGQSTSITMNGSTNCHVITGDAGEYTFTYNSGTQALTVEYPDSHPSSNYVYFEVPDGWTSVYSHRWSGSAYNTSWPGWILGTTTIGDADYAFMSTYGLSNFNFHKNAKDGYEDIKTPDLSLATNAGKHYTGTSFTPERVGSWSANFPITITLNKGDHGASNETAKVNYNATSLTSSTPVSANEGYTLEGYYDGSTKVLEADLTYAGTNVDEYISGGKWVKNKNCTLTAKYTLNSHNLTWSLAGGSITSEGGTYTAAGSVDYGTALTAPTVAKEGYSFAGWSPSVPSTMPDEDVTCTATWSEDLHDVIVLYQCNGKSISDNGSVTAIGITTSESTTAPSITGYTFSSWAAMPSGVTTSSELTGATITINATADDKTIVANYTAVPQTFNGSVSGHETEWNNTGNWTSGIVPTSEHAVTIAAPVVVSTTDAVAKSINITTGGSITINADAKLVVEQSITKNGGATTEEDIFIASSSISNGTLIWGTTGTLGKATVAYYTKSHGTGTTDDVNQYIGTPFSDEYNNYNYYGAWVFKAKSDMSAWERLPMGTKMEPFVGYNVIYNSESAGHTFIMGGTLNSNGNVTCTCSSNSYGDENLLANSWVAPIDISKFIEAEDFSGVEATIYIFNSTSEKASGEAGYTSVPTGGNYTVYNLLTSGSIPSMQSFSVCGSGTVKLNYNRLVKGAGTVSNGPMKAPSRDIRSEMVSLTIHVNDENGWGDELKLFEHEDFSVDFENGWDSHKLMGYSQAPQMYAVSSDGNMAINSVPSFDNNVVAFQAGSASNEYTMSFAYDGEETLYLNDTKAAFSQEITEDKAYDFTAASGDNVARFTITKSPVYKVPTGIENAEGFTNSASKQMIDGTLYIIRDGKIYNAEGSLVK